MKIIHGESLTQLKRMKTGSVDLIVTSPPYWGLRNYGHPRQLGLERTYEQYVDRLMAIFDEARRVLKDTGSCWVNLADTYANSSNGGHRGKGSTLNGHLPLERVSPRTRGKQSLPRKCLAQIPARFALAMTARGWILRNEIIWHKPNAMPASVRDRFTVDYEKLFFFTKGPRYYFQPQYEALSASTRRDARTIAGDWATGRPARAFTGVAQRGGGMLKPHAKGRNMRSVWKISTTPFKDAHFAVFPEKLVEAPIRACSPPKGIVLDIFSGSGTTLVVAEREGRQGIGIELNREYVGIARRRMSGETRRNGQENGSKRRRKGIENPNRNRMLPLKGV